MTTDQSPIVHEDHEMQLKAPEKESSKWTLNHEFLVTLLFPMSRMNHASHIFVCFEHTY